MRKPKITDIQGPIPMILQGNGLELIFQYQKELMQRWVERNRLVNFPVDIDSREGQAVLKDFIGCITEELAETSKVYMEMVLSWANQDLTALPAKVQEFNEEVADVTHFMIEVLVLAGLEVEDLDNYITEYLNKEELYDALYLKGDILRTYLGYARQLNIQDGLYAREYKMGYKVTADFGTLSTFCKGGRIISPDNYTMIKELMWDTTYYGCMAKNELKNRPWRETVTVTNAEQFYGNLMSSFVFYMRLLDFIGMDADSIWTTYYLKNRVNVLRITQGY
jgi:hypothetical protein